MFAVLMMGIVVGGVASWFNQARHRKAARHARNEMERYRAETERLRAQLAGAATRPAAEPARARALLSRRCGSSPPGEIDHLVTVEALVEALREAFRGDIVTPHAPPS